MLIELDVLLADYPEPDKMLIVFKDTRSKRHAAFPVPARLVADLMMLRLHGPSELTATYLGWLEVMRTLGATLKRVHIEKVDPGEGMIMELHMTTSAQEAVAECSSIDGVRLKMFTRVPLTCEDDDFKKFNLFEYPDDDDPSGDINQKLAISELLNPKTPKA